MVSTVKIGLGYRYFGALLAIFFFLVVEHNYFGNTDYTLAFIFISVTVLLKQLASGQWWSCKA
jgi:hypothetical protein